MAKARLPHRTVLRSATLVLGHVQAIDCQFCLTGRFRHASEACSWTPHALCVKQCSLTRIDLDPSWSLKTTGATLVDSS